MTRRMRTQILSASPLVVLQRMGTLITERCKVEVLEEAGSGLVMIKMRESAMKHLFYLGEVHVTECKVMINGNIGLGVIRGTLPEHAYWLAVIDAAFRAALAEIETLESMILKEGHMQNMQRAIDLEQLMKTRVDFTTLDEEVKS